MTEVRHRRTGAVLFRTEAKTLAGANLCEAALRDANLRGANLAGGTLCETVLAGCRNLHEARGLLEARHAGASTLDVRTLRASAAALPEGFLVAVGCTATEIDVLCSLYPNP